MGFGGIRDKIDGTGRLSRWFTETLEALSSLRIGY
jgi:hypothetical protein